MSLQLPNYFILRYFHSVIYLWLLIHVSVNFIFILEYGHTKVISLKLGTYLGINSHKIKIFGSIFRKEIRSFFFFLLLISNLYPYSCMHKKYRQKLRKKTR